MRSNTLLPGISGYTEKGPLFPRQRDRFTSALPPRLVFQVISYHSQIPGWNIKFDKNNEII